MAAPKESALSAVAGDIVKTRTSSTKWKVVEVGASVAEVPLTLVLESLTSGRTRYAEARDYVIVSRAV
jgi:hypothetical protein